MLEPGEQPELDDVVDVEDEKFDLVYPPRIRQLSSIFWTPVRIASEAARLLVTRPGIRVLDVGCGPGKFCLVAASQTDGHFTGVEQRASLVTVARTAAEKLQLSASVDFIAANITDTAFAGYDAFYIFNPFEENMSAGYRIDSAVSLSPTLFKRYTSYVAAELGQRPIGTRVVTYMGYADEIPACYSCDSTYFNDDLKLWIKTRDYDPDADLLNLSPRRSYNGSAGWAPPRLA